MLLVGKLEFKNNIQYDGIEPIQTIHFQLPHKLRRRARVKLKHFSFFQGDWRDNVKLDCDTDVEESIALYTWRQVPSAVHVSFFAHGEDLMNNNVSIENEEGFNANEHKTRNINHIRFPRNEICQPKEHASLTGVSNGVLGSVRSLSIGSSHVSNYDLNVFDLEETVSEIEVRFEIIPESFGFVYSDIFGYEDLIRMDTITIILELIE